MSTQGSRCLHRTFKKPGCKSLFEFDARPRCPPGKFNLSLVSYLETGLRTGQVKLQGPLLSETLISMLLVKGPNIKQHHGGLW
jgi:hypothetical protein